MYTVYVLHSSKYQKIYVGYSSDLDDRFLSHNKLATKGWTIKFRPWTLAHTEEYETKKQGFKGKNNLSQGRAGNGFGLK
jgi:putative endonuclease